MWALHDNGSPIDWKDAKRFCREFSAGGFQDWRLPTGDDLVHLYDVPYMGRVNPIYDLAVKDALQQTARGAPFKVPGGIVLSDRILWTSDTHPNGSVVTYDVADGYDVYNGEKFLRHGKFGWDQPSEKEDLRAICVRGYSPPSEADLDVPGKPLTQPPTIEVEPFTVQATVRWKATTSDPELIELGKRAKDLYDSHQFAEAMPLIEKNCDSGDQNDCDRLGYMYANGIGVAMDHFRAVKLFAEACKAGQPGGCASLGYEFENGLGVRADVPRAKALYQMGCKLGDTWACSQPK